MKSVFTAALIVVLLVSTAIGAQAAPCAPTITSQPQSQTVCPGTSVTFSVTATSNGGGTLTYQWRKGGTNILGATARTYTIASVSSADAGSYDCRVKGSNCNNQTNSDAAVLTLIPAQVVTEVSETPFSPNQATSAGASDNTVITIQNPATVSVPSIACRIRTGTALGGTLVRELTLGALAAGASGTVTWDGKDAGGSFVAEGTYTARAYSPCNGENDASAAKFEVVVDNTNPTVTLVSPANGACASGGTTLTATPTDAGGNDSNIDYVEFYVGSTLVGSDASSSGGWSANFNSSLFTDGTYTWTARAFDEAGNNTVSAGRTIIISSAVGPAGSISGSASVCAGVTAVGYSIASVGGATTYTWSVPSGATIASGQGTTSISVNWGTTSGNVSVTPSNPCFTGSGSSKAVAVNPLPTAEILSKVDASCFGASNGSATASPGAGTPPYSFAWNTSPVQTTATASGLGAGTYTVTVTDLNGCTAAASTTIGQPAALVLSESHIDASCFAASDGSVNLSVSGGTAPYGYSWSNGASSEDVSGLAAGGYSVTVTDAQGCSATLSSIAIAQPAVLALSQIPADASCFGANDGSINLTVSGGTGPFSFSWSNGASSEDVSGLAPGSYSVTVTDAHGCSATLSGVAIGQPAVLELSQTHADATCFGGIDGYIDLTVSGGTTPYTYSWSNGATSQDALDLAAGSYSVTVTDAHGCSATLSSIGIDEPESPTLTPPPSVTANAGLAATVCGATVSDAELGSAVLSGGCDNPVIVRTGVPQDNLFPAGVTTVTYQATFANGYKMTVTQSVTVIDDTPPVLALVGSASLTHECHSPFNDPGASASDLCAGDLGGQVQVTGSVNADVPGSYTLTYSVNDGHGNAAPSVSRTVNVVDTTPPALSLIGGPDLNVQCHAPFIDPGVTATDLCAGDLSSQVQVTGSVDTNTLGGYTLTYSVSDGHGHSSSVSRFVNVVDTVPPALSLIGAPSLTVQCHAPFIDPGATASDLCAGDVSSQIQVSGSVNPDVPGSYTLTYSVSDGHGNVDSISRTVNVVDTVPPAISLIGAPSMPIECHSSFSDPGATASDLCAGDLSAQIQASGSVNVNVPGSYVRTYTVSDGHGNNASVSRTVNVVDTAAPVISLTGGPILTQECHSAFSDPGATASDLCAGDLTAQIQITGSVNADVPGSYTLTYSVSDGQGHTASATRTVNVVDTTPPVLLLVGSSSLTTECHSPFNDPGAISFDLCAGFLSPQIQASGNLNLDVPGTYTRTYSVNDGNGNTATVSRTVIVVDTTPPAISLVGAPSLTVECHSPFSDPGATASDLCAGNISGQIQVAGSVNANVVGSYTLTYSVSDGQGNSTSATRTVNVVDTTPPAISLVGASSMTVECHGSFSDPGATASDLCAGNVSAQIQVGGSVNPNAAGTYTLTYSVSDGHGNNATVSRTVNVVDTTPPALSLIGASSMTVQCHGTFSDPGATASDLCAGDLTAQIQVGGTANVNVLGTYTLVYLVSDGRGNYATVSRTVNVVDTTPPAISLVGAPSLTIECHSPFSDPGATASDLCAGSLNSEVQVSGSVDPNSVGTYTLTYSVSDGQGNNASVSRTVNVVDTTPPAISLVGAPSLTIECHSPFSDPGATASDLCAGNFTTQIQMSGNVDVNAVGSYTRTYTVSDGNGNNASVSRTVNVVDTTPPAISLVGSPSLTVECHSSFSDPGATASDLCAGNISAQIQVSGSVDVNAVGSYTQTYTVSDGHGNNASVSRTVNVVDTTPPTLSLTGGSSLTQECHGAFSDPGATASDLCAGNVSAQIQVSGSVNVNLPGSYTLTYSVSDGHGNSASATRTVNVVDTAPPSIALVGPATQTLECHSVFSDPGAIGFDQCAGFLTPQIQVSGSVNPNVVGSYTLTYSVSDGNGYNASVSRTVNVVDTTPPAVSLVGPASLTLEYHNPFSDPGATASDLCAGSLSLQVQVLGSVNPDVLGSYTLTYSVTDGQGNTGSTSRIVNVVDTTAPAISLVGASTMTVECHSGFSDPGATATDLYDGNLSAQIQVTGSVNANAVGTYTLTYSVTDSHGNRSSITRTVRIVDTTLPTLQVPLDVTRPTALGASVCGVVVSEASLGTAAATDLCAGSLPVGRAGVPSGNLFPVGVTTITYAAVDPSGNIVYGTQKVTVVDATLPAVVLPANVVRNTDPGVCSAMVSFTPTATDNCPGVTVTSSPPSGFVFPVGTTTVTCTAKDAANNTTSGTFTVTVLSSAPLASITGPPSGAMYSMGSPVSFAGTLSDGTGDVHTAQWTIDGAPVAGTVAEFPGTVEARRTFRAAGVYRASLAVTDQCGSTGTASQVDGLDAMVVVYDARVGYVAGGGWFDSPLGALVADPDRTGRASFGFVSGPNSQPEFLFKFGNLDFHSSAYDQLVLSGAFARYTGSGSVNGAADYDFLLSLVDGQANGGGGLDRFRMKITVMGSQTVVYDSQMGAPDTAAAATVIGGGSIAVHLDGSSRESRPPRISASQGPVMLQNALAQNAPNPFRGRTEIAFSLAERSQVRLMVYDISGRVVASLSDGEWEAGPHSVSWSGRRNGGDLARGGVYFVRIFARSMESGREFASHKKMILVE